MAAIYDYETGDEITVGLQGSDECDEAIRAARRIADERGEPVELHDDDGRWLVHPAGEDGSHETDCLMSREESEAEDNALLDRDD